MREQNIMNERFSGLISLLMFSFFSIIAAGMVISTSAVDFLPEIDWPNQMDVLRTAVVFAVVGGLFSLLHPGKKMRSPRAIIGFGHSWLSREAVFTLLFTLLAGAAYFVDLAVPDEYVSQWLNVTAAVFGLALVISIGQIYRLEGQRYWKNPIQYLSPLASTFLMASCFLVFEAGALQWDLLFFTFWVIDAALLLFRILFSFRLLRQRQAMVYPGLRPLIWFAFLFRLAASILVMLHVMFLILWAIPYLLAVTVFLDRFCFFAGAMHVTPAAEIGRIREARMKTAASA